MEVKEQEGSQNKKQDFKIAWILSLPFSKALNFSSGHISELLQKASKRI